MTRQTLAACIATLLPLAASAQSTDSYQCTLNGLERRVEIARETAAPVPCQVLYFKDSEAPGERQVLWSAANEAGYCETQAQSFVSQLEGWGWQCTATRGTPAPAAARAPAAPAAPAEPVADDTDALGAPPE